MASRVPLNNKTSGESINVNFDFTSVLNPGETLSSATVTASVYTGVDPAPSAIVSGSASISGSVATQLIIAGIVGVIYELLCAVTTSAGQTLNLVGLIGVVPGLP